MSVVHSVWCSVVYKIQNNYYINEQSNPLGFIPFPSLDMWIFTMKTEGILPKISCKHFYSYVRMREQRLQCIARQG